MVYASRGLASLTDYQRLAPRSREKKRGCAWSLLPPPLMQQRRSPATRPCPSGRASVDLSRAIPAMKFFRVDVAGRAPKMDQGRRLWAVVGGYRVGRRSARPRRCLGRRQRWSTSPPAGPPRRYRCPHLCRPPRRHIHPHWSMLDQKSDHRT